MTEGLIHDVQIGEKTEEKNCRVYVGFMDLEKAYDRVDREAVWQVLRMYDVDNKLFKHTNIKNMNVNNLAYVTVKGGKSECFRINSGVRQGYIV